MFKKNILYYKENDSEFLLITNFDSEMVKIINVQLLDGIFLDEDIISTEMLDKLYTSFVETDIPTEQYINLYNQLLDI